MSTVIVLGGSGMLGSMLVDVLSSQNDIDLIATIRSRNGASSDIARRYVGVKWIDFDASGDIDSRLATLPKADFLINAIGITKPMVHDDNAFEVERAIRINCHLPHRVAAWAEASGCRILQIATDCVWSGKKGSYLETDPHDALDVYGKTKSLGEVVSPKFTHLRCSIIGPEPKEYKFLIEWFRRQPNGAQVTGFTDHQWNGLTTLHFARICLGVIRQRAMELPRMTHVLPSGRISKADMLAEFAKVYMRGDVRIVRADSGKPVDRTLSTVDIAASNRLWVAAGYNAAPTVPQQLAELAAYEFRGAPVTNRSR